MSAVGFLQPLALWALAALPLLWWLLRLSPPAPRRQIFPALALLQDLRIDAQSPARTPWWLLLLRLALLLALILGFARPVLAPPPAGGGPLVVLIDNGWAGAGAWPQTQDELRRLCAGAERDKHEMLLLPTAPEGAAGRLAPIGPLPATSTCARLQAVQPRPWPADHAAALDFLRANLPPGARAVWLSDGVRTAGSDDLRAFLADLPGFALLRQDRPLYLLRPGADAASLTVERLNTGLAASVTIEARDGKSQLLDTMVATFAPGDKSANVPILPPRPGNGRVARFALGGQRGAGAVLLRDAGAGGAKIGLLGDEVARRDQPLLSGLHYLSEALRTKHALQTGAVGALIEDGNGVIVSAGDRPLLQSERDRLAAWVQAGGVLIQFAGSALAQDDGLLPAPLRMAARNLGGALSWETPQHMQAFAPGTPFAGLAADASVTVARQVLADPAALPADAVWAALADGTPLVTQARRGRGLAVLVHVPATPEWSSLPLAGLFPAMLERLIEFGQTGTVVTGDRPLPPVRLLDGFGELQPPPPELAALPPAAQAAYLPGPGQPPGYYGIAPNLRAFNLGDHLPQLQPFAADAPPPGAPDTALELRPWLLGAAGLLALLDLILALALRGLLGLRARLGMVALLLCLTPGYAMAEPMTASNFTATTWLGVVVNGASGRAQTGEQGLKQLARRLHFKTSLEQVDARRVDLERDDLAFYPFLYWPLESDPQLSPMAQRKLQDYAARGGMLLLDVPGLAENNPLLTEGAVPLPPLARLTREHPLLRSFYLLDDCTGRLQDGAIWTERDSAARQDGVPAIFVGSRDWARAWAEGGRQGDRATEMAFRCGVNFVIYALTGNYKSDQVHLPALLERLRR